MYLKRTSDPLGTLTIDNNNLSTVVETTQISSNVTDAVVGDVVIRNAGKLRVVTNQTLTVQGGWTNSGTFTADTNSTVVFTGANTATVYRGETFYNLTGATQGKQLNFLAGSTTIVYGTLTMQNVDLRSTVDGTWWYLRVMPSGTHDVKAVFVKDSNATNGLTIFARWPSHNSGHNVNWLFEKNPGTILIVR